MADLPASGLIWHFKPKLQVKKYQLSGSAEILLVDHYRVTHRFDSKLPLTSKQKFCFGLACSDLDRPNLNFYIVVNGRFEST